MLLLHSKDLKDICGGGSDFPGRIPGPFPGGIATYTNADTGMGAVEFLPEILYNYHSALSDGNPNTTITMPNGKVLG